MAYTATDLKIGEAGCTGGHWWVIGNSGERVACESVADAVRRLCPSQTSLQSGSCEELLDLPFDELSAEDWRRLLESELVAA